MELLGIAISSSKEVINQERFCDFLLILVAGVTPKSESVKRDFFTKEKNDGYHNDLKIGSF